MTPSVATACTTPTNASQRNCSRSRIGSPTARGLRSPTLSVEDRLADRARLALHQPLGRLAVAEADRLEDLRREVQPEGLQRHERDAGGDVEDARAEEGEDEPGQRAHLEADVLREVVVEPAT